MSATDKQMFNREVWLQALESGEWSQTRFSLTDEDYNGQYSFCCLGVAEACMRDGEPLMGQVLTKETREKLGIRREDPWVLNPTRNGVPVVTGKHVAVSFLNDKCRFNFKDIAAVLRPLLARRDYDGNNP